MSKAMIEIATVAGPDIVEGKVAWLNVGVRRHKFFLHDGNLTDYRSGYRVAPLDDARVRRLVATGGYTEIDDRAAAQDTIDLLVARAGQARVLAELARHPTLNG